MSLNTFTSISCYLNLFSSPSPQVTLSHGLPHIDSVLRLPSVHQLRLRFSLAISTSLATDFREAPSPYVIKTDFVFFP